MRILIVFQLDFAKAKYLSLTKLHLIKVIANLFVEEIQLRLDKQGFRIFHCDSYYFSGV